jgi:hypothetical protein
MSSRSQRRAAARSGASAPAALPLVLREGSELCFRCGLCCDGGLFSHVPIGDDEVPLVESLGLSVYRSDDAGDRLAFLLPCPKFADGCCSVYAERPRTCREYRCALLDRYQAGQMSLDSCLDAIEQMRSMQRIAEQELGLPWGSFTELRLDEELVRLEADPIDADQSELAAMVNRNIEFGAANFSRQRPPLRGAGVDRA